MEEINCPLCSSKSFAPFLSCRDHVRDGTAEYLLVCCNSCRLIYVNPPPEPEQLTLSYSDEYRDWIGVDVATPVQGIKHLGLRRKRRALEKYSDGLGRLLDVGCGEGNFVLEARLSGWDAVGTEVDSHQAALASRIGGAEVRVGDLTDCHFEEESFDVVTMWHVLEHLRNPLETLAEVHKLLKPGGLLIVMVPDCSCLAARLFKASWSGYDPPRHLCNFSPDVLEDALVRAGFDRIDTIHRIGSYDLTRISLEFLIKDRVANTRCRHRLLAVIDNTIPRLLLAPTAFERAAVTAFARRAS